jgi:hypothetical protein
LLEIKLFPLFWALFFFLSLPPPSFCLFPFFFSFCSFCSFSPFFSFLFPLLFPLFSFFSSLFLVALFCYLIERLVPIWHQLAFFQG